jgi:large subunit ribosomal protein L9
MPKTIDVILTETMPGVGRAGEQKKVKLGHYQNYLMPQKLALIVNKANLNQFDAIKKREQKRLEEVKAEASKIQKSLNGKTITFRERAQENGKLYGSVTRDRVSAEIKEQYGVSIESKYFLFSPIKEITDLTVKVELHPEHAFSFKVSVVGEAFADEESAEPAPLTDGLEPESEEA